jgi:hypothetical protein
VNGEAAVDEQLRPRHLRCDGFSAWADACAQSEGEVWLLSMLGNQQAVKAIWARLIKGETAFLAEDEHAPGRQCHLAREAWGTWRFYRRRLPSGAAHQGLLVPELASFGAERRDFLLVPRTTEEAPSLHYRFLNRRIDLPLHASWTEWLWQRGLDTGETEVLEAFGIAAYRCRPDSDHLREDITAGLSTGCLGIGRHAPAT